MTDISASQHLRDIVEAQSGLMKRSPYLRMQVQMEIIALREFQAGKTTSSAVRKLPLHTDEIAETKATRFLVAYLSVPTISVNFSKFL